eukprot:4765218-Alexandrium_andersonii.AAC.1
MVSANWKFRERSQEHLAKHRRWFHCLTPPAQMAAVVVSGPMQHGEARGGFSRGAQQPLAFRYMDGMASAHRARFPANARRAQEQCQR